MRDPGATVTWSTGGQEGIDVSCGWWGLVGQRGKTTNARLRLCSGSPGVLKQRKVSTEQERRRVGGGGGHLRQGTWTMSLGKDRDEMGA